MTINGETHVFFTHVDGKHFFVEDGATLIESKYIEGGDKHALPERSVLFETLIDSTAAFFISLQILPQHLCFNMDLSLDLGFFLNLNLGSGLSSHWPRFFFFFWQPFR